MCQNVPAMNMVELIPQITAHRVAPRAEAAAHLQAAAIPALLMTLGAWITKNVAKKKAIPKPLVTPYKILSTSAHMMTAFLKNAFVKQDWLIVKAQISVWVKAAAENIKAAAIMLAQADIRSKIQLARKHHQPRRLAAMLATKF